jgi:2-keto-4-pentenoate hydratase/2-oxohepta-3-ene-1,7-dioic acid hydratase in catechol pathway
VKFVAYTYQGGLSFGLETHDKVVVDLPAAAQCLADGTAWPSARTLDQALLVWEETLSLARASIEMLGSERKAALHDAVRSLSVIRLESPVCRPGKIIGVGLNYADHCREQGIPAPGQPVLFAKLPTSLIGPDEPIRWNVRVSARVDFEAELGVIIGRRATAVSRNNALDFVAGYTALNDVTARDLQVADKQWVRAKSLDTFCPMGPELVTPDEIGNPNRLGIRCAVNDIVYQDSNTKEMIFPVADLIAFITQGITLEPGDVIATGTPHGVGVFRKPPVFLRDGDEVIVSIEKIGVLRNRVETVDSPLA